MPQTECNGILNTNNGLWLIAVNSDGTYSWGNAADAVCFSEQVQSDILAELGEGFVGQNPPKPR